MLLGYLGHLHSRCHRGHRQNVSGVLTVGVQACAGILELLEGLVSLERLTERLCTLWANAVGVETVDKARLSVSGSAEGRTERVGQRTPGYGAYDYS